MTKEEFEKMNRDILELVNAAAQNWVSKERSIELLMEAKQVAEIRNHKLKI